VVFCVDDEIDYHLYTTLMRQYFPRTIEEELSCGDDGGHYNEWGERILEERKIR